MTLIHSRETHRSHRAGWLRAAVLGANDGIVSVASLIIGIAASHATLNEIFTAGVAGLVAGALAMAAGEYVSVASQRDAERADIDVERREQRDNPQFELAELAEIYVGRGVEPALAREVATQLMATDALGSHLRDELGLSEGNRARPSQAAAVSAASFASGGVIPVLLLIVLPSSLRISVIGFTALVLLGIAGAIGAWAGGARKGFGALRVLAWGGLAMGVTALIGRLLGAAGF